MGKSPPLQVKVWGDYACFTRPEMKVERVSYPVMTPSAARGILEAIFWKPEFYWRVRQISVLKPIKFFSILRNEINSRQSHRSAASWIETGGGFFADEDRTQRHSLVLRDVAYIISADVCPHEPGEMADVKYRDQFRRRVQKGQYYHHPYLGCREFPANFGVLDGSETPIPITDDLGLMLWDMDYEKDGSGKPRFFHAQIVDGVISVPDIAFTEEG